MRTIKLILKYLLATFFVLAGINHFRDTDFYMRIMPPYLPWQLFLVYLSGVFEIALGVLVITTRYRRVAAWGLIALLIGVFPANLHMAFNPELYPEFSRTALWLRLPLQAVFVTWAFLYTGDRVEAAYHPA
jgi:uncharacterized membrane protein